MANGDRVACHGVALRIGDEFFTVDYYTIPLDCYDMVLGVSFLRTLDPILWDFDDLCTAFWNQGHCVLWKGIGSTSTDIPPTGRLFTISKLESALLDRLLSSFDDVFEQPSGLPPQRACDHRIHLLPKAPSVAVRPYRYPQLQKNELETQCSAMPQYVTIFSSSPSRQEARQHMAFLCGLPRT